MYTEQSNLPLPRRYRAVLERTRSTQRVPRPVPGRRARGPWRLGVSSVHPTLLRDLRPACMSLVRNELSLSRETSE